MAQAFRIETLDRSGRWYLTPGARSVYDLRVRNDSRNAVDCSLVVDEPAVGVSVEPATFSLQGHEVRTLTVAFSPDASSSRAHRALLTLRSEQDGSVLATFEHPLVITGGTDCSIAMAWKDAIVEAGELRGFQVACSVRSQSESVSTFQLSLSEHPALAIPQLPPISLEPGQVGEMIVPIHWNRDKKDDGGWNHPLMIEAAVPVSNGRRISRLRWESIELKLEPFMKKNGTQLSVTVSAGQPQANAVAASSAPVTSAPENVPVAPAAQAKPEAASAPATANAPSSVPAAAQERQAQPKPAAQTNPAIVTPAAAEAAKPAAVAASIPQATAAQTASEPSSTNESRRVPTQPAAPSLLMLNGHKQLLMLAAAVEGARSAAPPAPSARAPQAQTATPPAPATPPAQVTPPAAAPLAPATPPAQATPPAAATPPAPATPATPPAQATPPAPATLSAAATPPASPTPEPIELSLFPGISAATAPPIEPKANGKHDVPPAPPREPSASATAPSPKADSAAAAAPVKPPAPPTEAKTPTERSQAPERPSSSDPVARPAAVNPVSPASPASVQPSAAAPAQPSAASPVPVQPVPAAEKPKPAQTQAPAAAPTVQAAPAAPTVTWTVKKAVIDEPQPAATAPPVQTPAKTSATAPAAGAQVTPSAATPAAASAPSTAAPNADASAPASQHTPTSPAPAVPPAKLTPYAPARWEGADQEIPVRRVSPAAPPAQDSVSPSAVQTPRVARERPAITQTQRKAIPAGFVIGGLAGLALLVAGVLIFKPTTPASVPATTPVATQTQAVVHPVAARPVAVAQRPAVHAAVRPVATPAFKPTAAAQTPHPTATPAPTQTPKAATPKPETPKPATPKPAAKQVTAWHQQSPAKPVSHYATLYQPVSGSTVALGSVEAYYGPRGRAVRVMWGAAEQASATVSLIDDHGATVSSTSVRGGRSSALLYLPRGFHGALTVQVSSVGRMGERVATTTSLPAFGR